MIVVPAPSKFKVHNSNNDLVDLLSWHTVAFHCFQENHVQQ